MPPRQTPPLLAPKYEAIRAVLDAKGRATPYECECVLWYIVDSGSDAGTADALDALSAILTRDNLRLFIAPYYITHALARCFYSAHAVERACAVIPLLSPKCAMDPNLARVILRAVAEHPGEEQVSKPAREALVVLRVKFWVDMATPIAFQLGNCMDRRPAVHALCDVIPYVAITDAERGAVCDAVVDMTSAKQRSRDDTRDLLRTIAERVPAADAQARARMVL